MEPTRSDARVLGPTTEGVVRGCPVDCTAVRSALSALERPRVAWADGGDTVVAGGATTAITASGRDRFATVRRRSERLFDQFRTDPSLPAAARPRLFGGFSFTDEHAAPADGRWAGFPAAKFVLPAVQLSLTPEGPWLTTTAAGPGAAETANSRLATWRSRLEALPRLAHRTGSGVDDRAYTPGREVWDRQVADAVDRINRGTLEKVVLAQALRVSTHGAIDVPDVVSRLADQYPDCYRFMFEPPGGGSFFGATPERLVAVRDGEVRTEALAGSIARGDSPEADAELARQLQDSEKNVHEHELVVDAICDQLRELTAEPETGERTVRRLANVQHLETPITASLPTDEHVLTLVEALHPTPAVGGLPPAEALRTIRDTETFDRGWYAAPVGWIDADGNGTFAVAIRSAIAAGRTATLFAGAGIVSDSEPDREWEELQLKYRPILDELA